MNWSFSFKLMPGEEVLDQPPEDTSFGLKTVHTPILTNRRAMFRFNSLSSGLVQSFTYDEISDVRPANRLMISYLRLTSGGKDYYLNVDDPEELALKIMGFKQMGFADDASQSDTAHHQTPAGNTPEMSRPASTAPDPELLDMLVRLRDAGILTDMEFEQKKKLLG